MSSVDNRIVEMQFDNKQFESNVQTSIKSLDNLKRGLNLEGAAKGLSDLDRAGKRFSLDGIASGVDTIASKFSAMGIIGITALQNITNSAINAGKKIISSLTIDPIKTGLNEYETKMDAIKTILSNTKANGTNLDDVNAALKKLNEYSDNTVYNFAQMSDMVGKFAAKSGELESSVSIVQGLANLAAEAGVDNTKLQGALYQVSQMAETVKSLDWSSLDTAGLGTVKFKNDLIDMAKTMGTIDTSTLAELNSGAVSFRDTLKDNWLTKGVFSAVTDMYALDEAMTKSAGEVTTFTKLMIVMRETVQSGWAISWEHIIGNKEQSTEMLTSIKDAFSNLIKPSTDARNNMLAFWNANGGRDAVVEAITNSFKALQSILGPITKGFREVFPAMTGERLVAISVAIRDITRNFKMSDETAEALKATFKGLFALVGIGVQAFTAIAKGLGSLISLVLPAGKGILDVTSYLGYFFVGLNKTIKSTDAFGNAIKNFGTFMKPIADDIKSAISSIIDAFKSFEGIDLSGLDLFSDRVETRFKPFTIIGNIVATVITKIADRLKEAAPIIVKISNFIGGAFTALSDNIINALGNADFRSTLDFLNAGLFTALLIGLKDVIKSLSEGISVGKGFIGNFKGILTGITGVLDGVKGSLQAYQSQLKAGTLMKIAIALAILTASLVALSLIDSAKLTVALTAMSIMLGELVGSMAILEKVMAGKGVVAMGKLSIGMIGLSVGVLILSVAMGKLAELDWEDIVKGLTAIGLLSATLVASANMMAKSSGKMISGALGMILFAAAINILAEAVKSLGVLDPENLAKGLIGVGVLLTELALFMTVTDFGGMGLLKGAGLVLLAASINILADAVGKFSEMDPVKMSQGLAAVGVVLTELGLFTTLTGNSKKVISTAIGLTILGAAMLIFAQAIGEMGDMSWEKIGKGLATMAGALTLVTVALNLMPKNMILTGTGLVIVAAALSILATVLQNMGSMTWEEIAKGLVTLAGSLTIIAVAMAFMTTALPGAAALFIVAAALAILAPVLQTFSSMSLSEIGKGLLALAGVFVVIGLAGLLLGPIVPAILGLGAGVALLGVGLLAAGAGLLLFSAGLAALAVSGVAGAAALVVVVTSIIGLLPMFYKTMGEALIQMAVVIGEGAPAIMKAVTTLLLGLIDVIIKVIPPLVEALFVLLEALLKTLLDHLPVMVDTGMKLILGLLKGISDNIKEVVATAIEIVVQFILGVASKLPDVIQAGIELMLSFINGLTDAINNNTDRMIEAVRNLMIAIAQAGLKVLTLAVADFKDAGSKIINAIKNAINEKIADTVAMVKDMATQCVDGLKSKVSEFFTAGQNVIIGFINGIKDTLGGVVEAAKNIGTSVINTVTDVLAIHSPSKIFDWIGKMVDVGMADGIADNSNKPVDATADMGESVIKEAEATVSEKKGEQIGNNMTNGVASGITKGTPKVVKSAAEMAKAAFDTSVSWIDEKKYYNQLSLGAELAAWERVQARYAAGSEERKKADREVYRVKQELIAKQTQLSEAYYAKEKEINDNLKRDTESLNDEYVQAIESRAKALYDAYGLFDKVEEPEAITGTDLVANLKTQIKEVDNWQNNINDLSAKGVSEDLIKELRDMGPKSAAQIAALTQLSSAELDEYVVLWQTKHSEATLLASNELEYMRVDTVNKIAELNAQASIELDTYRNMWLNQMLLLTQDVGEQLSDLKTNSVNTVTSLRTETEKEFTALSVNIQKVIVELRGVLEKEFVGLSYDIQNTIYKLRINLEKEFKMITYNIQTTINKTDWVGVGASIVQGMTKGVKNEAYALAMETAATARMALQAAKDALGINSPSKEFEELGMYSAKGLANGLLNFAGLVATAGKNVGNTAIDSLKSAVSNIADIVNGDLDINPTIRPVLDLTDVISGKSKLNALFDNKQGISVTSATGKISAIANGVKTTTNNETQTNGQPTQGSALSFVQNNYSPTALSRLDIYRQTKNQFSAMKGVVNGA